MEIFVAVAIVIIAWFAWQLYRAKKFNAFKRYINRELADNVANHIEQSLLASRSELTPNTPCHITLTKDYWLAYTCRILQYALAHELVTLQSLKAQGKSRFCQHLFHIEQDKLNKQLTSIS